MRFFRVEVPLQKDEESINSDKQPKSEQYS